MQHIYHKYNGKVDYPDCFIHILPNSLRSNKICIWFIYSSTPVLLPEEFHGQRSLAGYRPWGCKESDTTEHAHKIHLFPCVVFFFFFSFNFQYFFFSFLKGSFHSLSPSIKVHYHLFTLYNKAEFS